MAAVPPAPTLPCKECGFVNEPERVYCHNCGAKLDRSILPKEDQVRREPAERARKRIMRMTNPGSSKVTYVVKNALKVLGFAILTAVVVLAIRKPADTPPEKPEMSTRLVSSDLSQAMTSAQPKVVAFTQSEINAFLSTGKGKAGAIPGVVYKRSFVNLEPSLCRFTVERSYFGYSLYIANLYRPEIVDGSIQATNVGGGIGRLPIHPLITKLVGPLLVRDVAAALKADLDNVKKANGVWLEKGKATLSSRGGSRT